MGNNKHILATKTTVNCIPPAPPDKVQRLVSNYCAPPEGSECDASQKAEQTAALPSIRLTFFPSSSVIQSHAIFAHLSVNLYSLQLSMSAPDKNCFSFIQFLVQGNTMLKAEEDMKQRGDESWQGQGSLSFHEMTGL